MKFFKQIQAVFLSAIIAVMTFSTTTAFAAEQPTIASERVIRLIQINRDYCDISTSHSAAGFAFTSTSNELKLEVRYSNANTIIAVRLHDQTTGQKVGEWQTSSGAINQYVAVTNGHRYICEYLVASGSGTIHVTNTIYAVFR